MATVVERDRPRGRTCATGNVIYFFENRQGGLGSYWISNIARRLPKGWPMSNTSAIAKQYARGFGLWLLDHDNKIFGVILALIALDNWRMMYARFDEYSVYLMYGIYATPVLSLLSIA